MTQQLTLQRNWRIILDDQDIYKSINNHAALSLLLAGQEVSVHYTERPQYHIHAMMSDEIRKLTETKQKWLQLYAAKSVIILKS